MQMIASSKPKRAARISRAALGAALALGLASGGALLATPAAAKDKPAKLQMTAGFQKLAAPLQAALADAKTRSDVVAAKGNPAALATALAKEKADLEAVFAAVGNEDDRLVAGQFALQLGGLAEDQALQRRGIDAMLQSGKVAAADVPKLQFYSGQLAYVAKDYATARKMLQASIDGGYTENDPHALLAEAYLAEGQTQQGLTVLQQAIAQHKASGKAVPESWYKRGLSAAYKAKAAAAAGTFGAGLVEAYPSQQNWGAAITIIREIGGIPAQDMVDLLRLMGRTNSYAEPRDYIEYIQAADPRRLPGEVMQIIQAAGSKLPANDPTVADAKAIASERIAAVKASLPTLERDARSPKATAVTALASGDAFLSYGDAATAEALYTIALSKPGVDQPRTLTRLGIAQVDQGKYAEAQATFAKITGPRKPIAELWAAYAASKAKPAA
jgi:hypothetical protein